MAEFNHAPLSKVANSVMMVSYDCVFEFVTNTNKKRLPKRQPFRKIYL